MPRPEPPRRAVLDASQQHVAAEIALARAQRAEARALRAESRQAQDRAGLLRQTSSAILDAAVSIADEILERRGIGVAEPVAARFHVHDSGSTGIELTVRLTDPASAAAAQVALAERFGGSDCDRLVVR